MPIAKGKERKEEANLKTNLGINLTKEVKHLCWEQKATV
jgi:hypothetical protein